MADLKKPPKGIAKGARRLLSFGRQASEQAPTNIFSGSSGRKGKRPTQSQARRLLRRLFGN